MNKNKVLVVEWFDYKENRLRNAPVKKLFEGESSILFLFHNYNTGKNETKWLYKSVIKSLNHVPLQNMQSMA